MEGSSSVPEKREIPPGADYLGWVVFDCDTSTMVRWVGKKPMLKTEGGQIVLEHTSQPPDTIRPGNEMILGYEGKPVLQFTVGNLGLLEPGAMKPLVDLQGPPFNYGQHEKLLLEVYPLEATVIKP